MIKRLSLIVLLAVMAAPLFAQVMTEEQYMTRYNAMVKNLGASGVGIETLLERWAKDYPENEQMLLGKFSYYLDKSRTPEVKIIDAQTYMGQKPTLALEDSLGKAVNYFRVDTYDDELFGKATQALDQAIQLKPLRLDLRFYRITALTAYEKESPDMAKADLKSLIAFNFIQKPKWEYPEAEVVDNEFFLAAVQEYCYNFFKTGSPASYEAFKDISLEVLKYDPDNVLFMDNVGSYYFVAAKDNKTALKYYNKVLKIKKDDNTAIKNCILMARKDKNIKLEKKYLEMMVQYAEGETDRLSAKARLDYYNKK